MNFRIIPPAIVLSACSAFISPAALAIEAVYEGPDGVRAMVFETNCLFCHSSQRSGAQRNGAPEGRNWDVYEVARANGDRIINRAVITMTMPPPASGIPPLNQEQRNAMLAWQAAGFPLGAQSGPQNPTFSFDDFVLSLPIVQVGNRTYNATLDLVRNVPDSPTGFGFVLTAAELIEESSETQATYDTSTGIVSVPTVDLLEDGAVTRTVSASMRFVQGSNPLLFMVTEVGAPQVSAP